MTHVQITYPVDALVSYHYYREDRDMAAVTRTGRLRLIGDSGAFSAHTQGADIDLAEYAAWCTRWRPHLYWCAALDVIGNPEATWRNWKTLRDRHRLDTVPTLHAGGDPKWLDAYAAEGVDFVGLGGLVGVAPRAFRWAIHMFRHARSRHPDMRFHLWGVTNRQYLDALPTYSADSSGTLGQAYRYGTLRLFDPGTGQHHSAKLAGRDVYRLASLLRRTYGVDPAEIETSHPGNRRTLILLAAASTQQYAAWLQRRHGNITAPTWALPLSPQAGTQLHMADTSNDREGRGYDLRVAVDAAAGPLAAATPNRADEELRAVAGPLVHVTCTSGDGDGRGHGLRVATEERERGGPVIHLVDRDPAHLATVHGSTSPTPPPAS